MSVTYLVLRVELQWLPAVPAAFGTPEGCGAAMRAGVAFLLFLHPLFGAEFPPPGDGPQYYLLADGNREIIDELAGELITLVAALYLFITAARFDRADLAV